MSFEWRVVVKASIIIFGLVFIFGGLGLLGISIIAGRVDTGSVIFLLSEDRIDQETLSKFAYTPWLEPTDKIRPFDFGDKSFTDCEILRYRRGSWPHWLVWRTYYEAEYQRPDGTVVIGPAFGPLPYTAPNLFVSVPTILVGTGVLTLGIKLKTGKIKSKTSGKDKAN